MFLIFFLKQKKKDRENYSTSAGNDLCTIKKFKNSSFIIAGIASADPFPD
jgi:hypothetical protein